MYGSPFFFSISNLLSDLIALYTWGHITKLYTGRCHLFYSVALIPFSSPVSGDLSVRFAPLRQQKDLFCLSSWSSVVDMSQWAEEK